MHIAACLPAPAALPAQRTHPPWWLRSFPRRRPGSPLRPPARGSSPRRRGWWGCRTARTRSCRTAPPGTLSTPPCPGTCTSPSELWAWSASLQGEMRGATHSASRRACVARRRGRPPAAERIMYACTPRAAALQPPHRQGTNQQHGRPGGGGPRAAGCPRCCMQAPAASNPRSSHRTPAVCLPARRHALPWWPGWSPPAGHAPGWLRCWWRLRWRPSLPTPPSPSPAAG